jgi:transcriptional regulator with XRE-family HTH domain
MLTLGMTLGETIRQLRDQRDLSLREFAKRVGSTPAHISDIENNRRNPSDELLEKIAAALSTPLEELKKLDRRVPLEELKEAIRRDPALGFALRKVAEQKVSAEDLLKLANRKRNDEERSE